MCVGVIVFVNALTYTNDWVVRGVPLIFYDCLSIFSLFRPPPPPRPYSRHGYFRLFVCRYFFMSLSRPVFIFTCFCLSPCSLFSLSLSLFFSVSPSLSFSQPLVLHPPSLSLSFASSLWLFGSVLVLVSVLCLSLSAPPPPLHLTPPLSLSLSGYICLFPYLPFASSLLVSDRSSVFSSLSFSPILSLVLSSPSHPLLSQRQNSVWDSLERSIKQSIFYFMSVHIEVILDKNKTKQTNNNNNNKNKKQHIIIIFTNFPTGLWTIDLTILVITSVLYKIWMHKTL